MQTFLPYADFDRSAACLDSPRLGKQRVETLQILRALTLDGYGWAHHPVTLMWRGYVPALTSYGLAMVDAWTGRGAADTTRALIAEFAPEAVHTPVAELALPSWLGREDLHRSHQSNLIRKDAAFYAPQFSGVPDDLAYVWPGTDAGISEREISGTPLVIIRPRNDAQAAEWIDDGGVTIGENSPAGKAGPKWLAQLELFSALPNGTRIAALSASGTRLVVGELLGRVTPFANEHEVGLRRPAQFGGELNRTDFPYPALLQDPRTLFTVVGPRD